MHITLIGMSNIGKTYLANRLAAEAGFEKIDCDTLVEKELGPELTGMGYAGIQDVAKWMGQPPDPQYRDTRKKFMDCEKRIMHRVIEKLRASPKEKSVIDTSGSVIYTGAEITNPLRALTRVVYLEASPAHVAHLFERYIAEPKPVVWDDAFDQKDGESGLDALKRCYPKLLESRAQQYARIAHVTVPFDQHHQTNFDPQTLLKAA